jgi:formylglycine-generating enzyme required for sulfatase activity
MLVAFPGQVPLANMLIAIAETPKVRQYPNAPIVRKLLNIGQIASPNDDMETVVFKVLREIEASSLCLELVKTAHEWAPHEPNLEAVYREFSPIQTVEPDAPARPAPQPEIRPPSTGPAVPQGPNDIPAAYRDYLQTMTDDRRVDPRARARAGSVLGALGDPRDLAEMMLVPAGPFRVGSNEYDDEKPEHEVDLPAFYIARYPVTNGQYARFVEARTYRPPDHWRGKTPPHELRNHPVVHVTWHDAVAYCAWLSEARGEAVRLPTEAEWEKAARGTDGRRYPWGDRPDPNLANYDDTGIGTTSPVGCFPGGASPYGCEEMAGNVWEWTSSKYQPYCYVPDDGREDPAGDAPRTLRGGSFRGLDLDVRCAYRFGYVPNYGSDLDGFRVVRSPGS